MPTRFERDVQVDQQVTQDESKHARFETAGTRLRMDDGLHETVSASGLPIAIRSRDQYLYVKAQGSRPPSGAAPLTKWQSTDSVEPWLVPKI
jgi:hypothetical protein